MNEAIYHNILSEAAIPFVKLGFVQIKGNDSLNFNLLYASPEFIEIAGFDCSNSNKINEFANDIGLNNFVLNAESNDAVLCFSYTFLSGCKYQGKCYKSANELIITLHPVNKFDVKSVFANKSSFSVQVLDVNGFIISIKPDNSFLLGQSHSGEYSVFQDEQLINYGFLPFFTKVRAGEVVHFPEFKYSILSSNPSEPTQQLWLKMLISPILNTKENDGRFLLVLEEISEIKSKEWELLQNEKKYRTIFSQAPLGIFQYDNQGVIEEVNNEFVRIIGSTRDALLGFDMFKLIQNKELLESLRNSLIYGDGSYEGIYDSLTANKSTYVKCRFVAVISNGGGYSGGIGIIEDITVSHRAQDLLEKSELMFRSITENSFDMISLLDETGKFSYCNPAHFKILGYQPEELIGSLSFSLNHHEDRASTLKLFSESIKNKKNRLNGVFRLVHKNGSIRWVDHRALLNYDAEGKFVSILLTTSDITERQKAESELEQSLQTYFDIFNSVSEAIYIQSEDGTFLDVNKGAEQMYNLNRNELVGINPKVLASPDFKGLEETQKLANETFSTGIPARFEFWAVRKNGTVFPKEVIVNKGKYFGKDVIIATARDISQQKADEERLRNNQLNFNNFFASANDLIIICSVTGSILYINKAVEDKLGFTESELAETGLISLYSTNNYREAIENVVKAFGGHQVTSFLPFQRKNGSQITVETKAWRGKWNNTDCVFSISADISSQTEALLKYNKFFENNPALITVSSLPDRKFTEVNSAFLKALGYKLEEVIGKTAEELNIFPNSEIKDEIASELLKKGCIRNVSLEVKTRDNRMLTGMFSADVFESNGKLYFITIATDITQQKEAETALLKSESQKAAILKAIPDLLFIFTKEGQYVEVYSNNDENLIAPKNEVIGKNIRDFFPPNLADEALKHFKEAIRTGELQTYSYSINIAGNVRTFESRIMPASNGQVLVIVRDINAQTQALEALKESNRENMELQEFFRKLADNMPDMLWAKDLEKRFLFVNKSICDKLLNARDMNEPIGKNDMFFAERERKSKPDDPNWHTFGEICSDSDSIVLETGETGQFDEFGNLKGRFLFLDVVKSPLRNENGEIIGIVGAARDVTDRKRLENLNRVQNNILKAVNETNNIQELIRFIQEQLNHLIDSKNFFIALYNPQTGMLNSPYFTDEIDEIKEWPAEGSCTGLIISGGKSLLLRRKDLVKLIESKKITQIGEIAACWVGVPLNSAGKIIGAIVIQSYTNPNAFSKGDMEMLGFISQNISIAIQRKRNEQQINLFGKSIEYSPASILITDPQGIIEYVNPKFSQITGFSSSEVIGKNPRILKSGMLDVLVYKDLWKTIRSGQQWFGELLNVKKSGEFFWENVSISPILDDSSNISHYIAIKEDITEKKKIIEELIYAKEKAQESDRLKSAFLANMSHEIRTPMNGILGFASLLKEPGRTVEEQKHFIEIIEKSGERMLSIINDLINISKIEAGLIEVFNSETNINHQVDFMHSFFRREAEEKHIAFSKSLGLSIPEAEMKTDREKLYIILSNLLKNSMKYTKEGSIEFGYILKNEFLEFYVKDTGIGIPEHMQKIIFDRFVQADMSPSSPYEGAGLGLAITKAYVEMLGGTIWLQSTEGQGSTFYFTLPYKKEISNSVQLLETHNNMINSDKLAGATILIAEDDPLSFLFLSKILQSNCAKIIHAKNGSEAVQFFQENPDIRLILMDIKMPIMNGYTATVKIREMNPEVVIIAQTAFALSGDREKALEAGCNEHIPKPFQPSELFEMIDRLL